jgi:hypothetical protein
MIGDIVKFKDYCDEVYTAKVVDILSDKFDEVKWIDESPMYYSKKTKSYRRVREKDMNSLYLELESARGKTDFIFLNDIIN